MKKYHAWILSLVGLTAMVTGAERPNTSPVPGLAARTARVETGKSSIVERWTDGRVWQRVTTHTLTNGTIVSRTNRWTELATGLHYQEKGQWRESRAEFSITPNGAVALQGPHEVELAGNINTAGAVTLTTPDGKTIRSQVAGLAYTDLATGESVLLATVRDSTGVLLPPNQVVYPSAFSGLLADLRYTYTKQGFEQDVILRESPRPPAFYGLNNETTALEVWTEFDAPEPQRLRAASKGLPDETISFGKMRILRGKAFTLGTPQTPMSGVPVGKTWLPAGGRQYLIESVGHRSVERELDKLPQVEARLQPAPGGTPSLRAGAIPQKTPSRTAWLNRLEPRRAAAATPVRMAVDKALINSSPGLVLDYIIYGGDETDFTFQADTTYLISDSVNMWGNMTLEGGTVIKIGTTNDTMISAYGEVIMRTDPYRPAIITSQNDRTVGLDFTAPGSPMRAYGGIATAGSSISYQHLRFTHLGYALSGYSLNVRDVQFVDCTTALYEHYDAADVDNVLFHRVDRAFAGSAYTISARHVTVNQCGLLTDDFAGPPTGKVALTNSLLVNVTNLGVGTVTTNYTITTTGNIFQTVGAGAHYLADPSPYRDLGTTNIPAALTARLRKTTTYPPLIIAPSGSYYGVSQTWLPRAGRDTDAPDLGYHYDPLDYAISSIYLTNATITVKPGTAIGVFNVTNPAYYGLALSHGAKLLAEGRAEAHVTFTDCATVQEGANTNWAGPIHSLVDTWNSTTGTPELRARFTDFTALGGITPHLYGNDAGPPWHLTDVQFHGGSLYNYGAAAGLTNVLFNRVFQEITLYSDVTNYWFNATCYGGSFNAVSYFSSDALRVHDALFVNTSLETDVVSSHIGYLGSGRLAPNTNATDRVLASLAFQTGPLGSFYVPTNTALANNGSRHATNAGLYHYTMLTNNVKETNTTVDIGFHYVATDAYGIPFDYDGDGVADYWEDLNGNGSADSVETDWRDANDVGLQIRITAPKPSTNLP